MRGSYEDLFHREGQNGFVLPIRGDRENSEFLAESRLERAIGVIYRPETERSSHYFEARLAEQFDALIHIDETRAIEPLAPTIEAPVEAEVPETFPSGV